VRSGIVLGSPSHGVRAGAKDCTDISELATLSAAETSRPNLGARKGNVRFQEAHDPRKEVTRIVTTNQFCVACELECHKTVV
jgi:hypothetical protein